MTLELGKHAFVVLASYGVTLALIAALVWHTLAAGRRAKAELEAAEKRAGRHGAS